jgi:hypothetical protein
MATFLLNAAAIPLAIANGRPAEFSTHDNPHRVSGQRIGSGTASSALIAPLAALAVVPAGGQRSPYPLQID